ncbi:MAG: PqiC family protein [Proteobacteria bacterium]|nr:PqiC family protein [Pseudomonadota bacterium]
MSKLCRILPVVAALLMTACSNGETVHHYMLRPAGQSVENRVVRHADPGRVIGVGPISMPEYLARSQLVLRDMDSKVYVLKSHRWAEPLEKSFSRVLTAYLTHQEEVDRFILYPSRSWSDISHQLSMEVLRFDADKQGKVTLEVQWQWMDKANPRNGKSGTTRLSLEYGPPGDYAGMADTMSRLVEQLAGQFSQLVRDGRD